MTALAILHELKEMKRPLDWGRIREITIELDNISLTNEEKRSIGRIKTATERNFNSAVSAVWQAFGRRVTDEDGFPLSRR
ncbi:hypothetical protein [Stappia indica]|uniref:hypothetical protein n=1 Tax=Stappia indica TaxID=538381 RepID=UPI001CD33812|nr:hypothetical protein [Stappia indica]MCA1298500.1 hypothetical protein [Stappia indica]